MKSFIIAFVNAFVIVFTLFVENLELSLIVIVLQLITNGLLLLQDVKRIFSIGFIFFILLALFHYGRVLVDLNDFTNYVVSSDLLLRAIKFSVISISFYVIGYGLSIERSRCNISEFRISISYEKLRKIKNISKAIFLISVIPAIYSDIMFFITTYSEGYASGYSLSNANSIYKWLSLIAVFARPSFLIFLLTCYKDKKKGIILLLLFIAYSILCMLSGARLTNIIYIIAALVVYNKFFIKKINLKQLLIYGIFACLFMYFLPMISILRTFSEVQSSTINQSFDASQENGLRYFFIEFGNTMTSLVYSMQFTERLNYGMTYLYSTLAISPSIPDVMLSDFTNNVSFTQTFPSSYKDFLGGSILGELYYNFGWLGAFLMFFIGSLIAKVEKTLTVLNDKNVLSFILCIILIPFLFSWVRGYFINRV